jgi:hypothetical protein
MELEIKDKIIKALNNILYASGEERPIIKSFFEKEEKSLSPEISIYEPLTSEEEKKLIEITKLLNNKLDNIPSLMIRNYNDSQNYLMAFSNVLSLIFQNSLSIEEGTEAISMEEGIEKIFVEEKNKDILEEFKNKKSAYLSKIGFGFILGLSGYSLFITLSLISVLIYYLLKKKNIKQ